MRLAAFLTRPTRCPIYRLPLPRLTPLPLTRCHDPFDDLDWLFELKLDGFRALAYVERGQGRLVPRNANTFKLIDVNYSCRSATTRIAGRRQVDDLPRRPCGRPGSEKAACVRG